MLCGSVLTCWTLWLLFVYTYTHIHPYRTCCNRWPWLRLIKRRGKVKEKIPKTHTRVRVLNCVLSIDSTVCRDGHCVKSTRNRPFKHTYTIIMDNECCRPSGQTTSHEYWAILVFIGGQLPDRAGPSRRRGGGLEAIVPYESFTSSWRKMGPKKLDGWSSQKSRRCPFSAIGAVVFGFIIYPERSARVSILFLNFSFVPSFTSIVGLVDPSGATRFLLLPPSWHLIKRSLDLGKTLSELMRPAGRENPLWLNVTQWFFFCLHLRWLRCQVYNSSTVVTSKTIRFE